MLSFNCTVYVPPIHGLKIQIINWGYNLLHIVSKKKQTGRYMMDSVAVT